MLNSDQFMTMEDRQELYNEIRKDTKIGDRFIVTTDKDSDHGSPYEIIEKIGEDTWKIGGWGTWSDEFTFSTAEITNILASHHNTTGTSTTFNKK